MGCMEQYIARILAQIPNVIIQMRVECDSAFYEKLRKLRELGADHSMVQYVNNNLSSIARVCTRSYQELKNALGPVVALLSDESFTFDMFMDTATRMQNQMQKQNGGGYFSNLKNQTKNVAAKFVRDAAIGIEAAAIFGIPWAVGALALRIVEAITTPAWVALKTIKGDKIKYDRAILDEIEDFSERQRISYYDISDKRPAYKRAEETKLLREQHEINKMMRAEERELADEMDRLKEEEDKIARARSGGASIRIPWKQLTKQQVYKMAQQFNISGRSKMSTDNLILELKKKVRALRQQSK